ncbi:unnamed protein product [Strongylus vulgaris]|uniref:SXP/RAL-2 family protein Ani s 5-like cation-binding domain-containing protein n=1 Tax=Strongylus vulgaris TaxID=40348 RepID=A0A3P7JTL0_STRVU|nr:unnamed protein product [Strongylus vulgaris]
MRSFALLLVLLATFVYAYDPVHIDLLEDIVPTIEEETELDILEDDKNMIRSEKKKKFDEILAKEPENIKKLYAMELERAKLKHQAKFERKMARATDPVVKKYLQKVEEINNDMSISDGEAQKKIKELKSKLTPMQRKQLKS